MTELEILQRAKDYIDKMANGIDPITEKEAADTDVINNVRISRCLFYVSDILRQVIENGGVGTKAKPKKEPFCLTDAQLAGFRYSEEPIPISEITKRFNALSEDERHTQLKHTQLTNWLVKTGLLQVLTAADGKQIKRPTEQGKSLGIVTEKRTGQYGDYVVVLYGKQAQRFLADHLDAVLADAAEEKRKKEAEKKESAEPQGLPWSKDDEDRLIDLYFNNTPVSQIAAALLRTEAAVNARLKKLGFTD